jgi:hypothetical protein
MRSLRKSCREAAGRFRGTDVGRPATLFEDRDADTRAMRGARRGFWEFPFFGEAGGVFDANIPGRFQPAAGGADRLMAGEHHALAKQA